MHPGTRIISYLLAALVIPGLSFFLVAILLLVALVGVLIQGRHPGHLIWRTRWLLMVLFLGYGFFLPGDAVVAVLGEWSPTWAGLSLGAERALRLVVLLLWLDVLVLSMPSEMLLSGLHALFTPLQLLGADRGRIALRMALTLKAIEDLEQRGTQHGRSGLRRLGGNLQRLFDPVPSDRMPDVVQIHHFSVGQRDIGFLLLLLTGFALLIWLGAWG